MIQSIALKFNSQVKSIAVAMLALLAVTGPVSAQPAKEVARELV
jgi:hypothetical protein